MKIKVFGKSLVFFLILFMGIVPTVSAFDSPVTRATLSGLQGVNVVIEDLNQTIIKYNKYLKKVDFTKEDLQIYVESELSKAGIRILTREQLLKTPGMPFLYININSHESENYWFAYDIRVELQQLVSMEANPQVKAPAATWSISVTGAANIGTLDRIKKDLGVLTGRFVQAYRAVNMSQGKAPLF